MKIDIPDGFVKVESPREKTRRIKAEGCKRFLTAKQNGTYMYRNDYGKQRLYRNERIALRNIPASVYEMTLEELTVATGNIFADERVKAIDPFPGENVYVENSCKNGAVAYPFERRMRFGASKSNFTLYHEIAHILTPGNGHGNEFCRVMCMLIEWFENQDAAEHMRRYL